MFDRLDDPRYLQSRLEDFIDRWHGWRKPWFGISAEKIALARLPDPLAWLYGFAGEWPGHGYWPGLLGNQDCLIEFENLTIQDGKLVFIAENQGVWNVGTESEGSDPPVWVRSGDEPWRRFDDSLTRFLVTFILHETVLGCRHVEADRNVLKRLADSGMHIAPLWIGHPYPQFSGHRHSSPLTFHVANGRYLVMSDGWCGTNEDSPWEELPWLFPRKTPGNSTGSASIDPFDAIPKHLDVPSILRRSHLVQVIRRHEAQAEYHQMRSRLFLAMLERMPDAE